MARRRKSPDKLLSECLEVLGDMIGEAQKAAMGEFETFSQRMMAVAKAADTLSKVEERRWAFHLGRMNRDDLAAFLQWREERALQARGVMRSN